jgi:segregation and condensation protein B
VAAGWTQPSQGEPTPEPRRSFADRFRSIRQRVSDSLAAGRRLLSAGLRAAGGVWNRTIGSRADPASPRKAEVVELKKYRAADSRPTVEERRPPAAVVVEEEIVEEMQASEAVAPVGAGIGADVPAEEEGLGVADDVAPVRDESVATPQPAVVAAAAGLEAADAADSTSAAFDQPEDRAAESKPSEQAISESEVRAVEPEDGGMSPEAQAVEAEPSEESGAEPEVEAKESEPADENGGEPEGDEPDGDDGESADASGDGEGGESREVEGDRLDSILESLLLAAGAPIPVRRICDALRSGPKAKEVRAALKRLQERYSGDCGIHLIEVSGGYQFRTAPANGDYVRHLLREKPARLGRATLETLSIVAYKQPVTRADIEAIRGVDADSALNTLLARKLIKIEGRKEAVGRPLLYATTPEFLEIFGLKDLKELPTLKEIGPVPEPEDEEDIEDTGIEEGEAAAAIANAAAGRTRSDEGPAQPNDEGLGSGAPGAELDDEDAQAQLEDGAPGAELDDEDARAQLEDGAPGAELDDEDAQAQLEDGAPGAELDDEDAQAQLEDGAIGAELDDEDVGVEVAAMDGDSDEGRGEAALDEEDSDDGEALDEEDSDEDGEREL